MFVITLINILALFLTILDSNKILKNGLKYAFIMVTVIAAIRYDYGNDYRSYMRIFETANKYSLSFIIDNLESLQYEDSTFKDIGAVIIYKIFHPFGFIVFAAFVSILTNYIYYKFILECLDRSHYWLGVYIYLFQFDFYVLPMSMIRQGLSIALCVGVTLLIKHKSIIKAIIIIILAVSIHKTSIIFVPFMLVFLLHNKNSKIIFYALILCTIVMYASSLVIQNLFRKALDVEQLQIYFLSYGGEANSELGFARKFLIYIPYFISMFYLFKERKVDFKYKIVLISTIGVLLYPLTEIVPLISRLCYYFNIFSIVGLPISLTIINNKAFRSVLILSIMIVLLYQYYYVFTNSIYTKDFINYQTIFS